jgi:hypothetical protein
MIYLLSVSIILLFVLVIVSVWQSGVRHWSLWIIIPFLIFNLGFSWYSISSLMGYAYNGLPPGNHQLLHAVVSKPNIYVLAQGFDESPRLYVFDYTDETARKIGQVKQQIAAGQRVMTKRPSKGALEFYNFELQKQYPKDHK